MIIDDTGNIRGNLYSQADTWNNLIENNLWIEYFIKNEQFLKENWIDFELEISKVIQSFDNDLYNSDRKGRSIKDEVMDLSNDFLRQKYQKYIMVVQSTDNGMNESITYEQIRDDLDRDLKKLIRALEIYLARYIEKQDIKIQVPEMLKLKPDRILSFNYTDIYRKIYDKDHRIEEKMYDFIYGQADETHTIENCNMVLGIDEYLPKGRRDNEIEFVSFKKYYQRIYKETGSDYLDWINEIETENMKYYSHIEDLEQKSKANEGLGEKAASDREKLKQKKEDSPKHYVYIFGHSLDITDKDIIKSLICCDNVYTTIYYHNNDSHARQVANLVKVIGKKELIKRTGGISKTIEFVKLQ